MAAPPKPSRQNAEAMADRLLKTIGVNVKSAREELGMSQRNLAAAAGMPQKRIVLIETAEANERGT
jgi:DNA-binding XRE family transcriptional regulator